MANVMVVFLFCPKTKSEPKKEENFVNFALHLTQKHSIEMVLDATFDVKSLFNEWINSDGTCTLCKIFIDSLKCLCCDLLSWHHVAIIIKHEKWKLMSGSKTTTTKKQIKCLTYNEHKRWKRIHAYRPMYICGNHGPLSKSSSKTIHHIIMSSIRRQNAYYRDNVKMNE